MTTNCRARALGFSGAPYTLMKYFFWHTSFLLFFSQIHSVFAFDMYSEHECYLVRGSQRPPTWNINKCRVYSSQSQGYYAIDIVFGQQLSFKVKGVSGGGPFGKTPDSSAVDNQPAAEYFSNQYRCWRRLDDGFSVCISK